MLLIEQNDEWLVGHRYLTRTPARLVVGHLLVEDADGTVATRCALMNGRERSTGLSQGTGRTRPWPEHPASTSTA
jgi:hypothetical protein